MIYDPTGKNREEEIYEYRKDGALIKAENGAAEVVLERDILGRVVKEITNGYAVESRYDEAGNRIGITSDLGADIRAGYNLMGDLTSLHANGWQTQYQRDLFGLEIGRTMQGGLSSRTTRDRLGRVTGHGIQQNNRSLSEKSYLWGINDQLLQIDDNGKQTKFTYDTWGNLSKTIFPDGKIEHRNPDKTGNLFESLDRMDRKYSKGGQLVKAEDWTYKYDKEGNLKEKKGKHGETWEYYWNAAGMLSIVKRPDGRSVLFTYDALGRRTEKHFARTTTKFVWDGNVPLHEWREVHTTEYSEEGQYLKITKEPVTTWVFEEGTFVPTAKLVGDQEFSIVTNYLGTPEAMYDEMGSKVWSCTLDSYGKVCNFEGQWKVDCPFRYQGQYEDSETGLYYNRFRYYSPEEGMYISQDPIRLGGNNPSLYGYVYDTNSELDILGLSCKKQVHHIIPNAVYKLFRKKLRKIKGYIQAKAHKNAKNRNNLIDLETPFHGNHPNYNKYVAAALDKLAKSSEGLTLANVTKLQNELRDLIGTAQNSGKTLNEYFEDMVP
ncbi:hypothetical protein D0T57_05710 [Dysgonomonas sp. 511]|nr:hypothetical protein [Dysgonomonas sp. 511]